MEYVLGIDQGGTKTAAVVMNREGHILGTGRGPGAYHISDGIGAAMEAVSAAAKAACAQAGLELREIRAVGAGITGMDWPEDYTLLYPALSRVLGVSDIRLFNDALGALYSGVPCDSGAVLCAGTGLNAAVRSPAGEEFVLGFYIEDADQGGSALARRAIQCVFQSAIGLEKPTRLTDLFLKAAGEKTADDLLHRYIVDEAFSRSVKDLVPAIVDCGAEDPVTAGLLERFAADISRYVRAGLERFHMLQTETDVVLSGSVFKGGQNLLTDDVTRDILGFAPRARVVNARFEPVVGTALAALSARPGLTDFKTVWNNLAADAALFGLERQ